MSDTSNLNGEMTPIVSLTASGSGLPSYLAKLILEDLETSETLAVVRIPLVESAPFLESLARYRLTRLPASHLYALTQRLLSLFEFSFTPTAPLELPIRVDILIQRICQQPLLFLPNLSQQVTEWFGFMPDVTVRQAWLDIIREKCDGVELSEPLQTYQERGLAAVIEDEVLVPLIVLGAWRVCSRLPDWDTLPELLHKMRHALMRADTQGERQETYYRQITAFMLNANPSLEGHQYRMTQARGELVDLPKFDWSQCISAPLVEATLVALQALFDTDHSRYRQVFNRVHGRLWDRVYQAIENVTAIKRSVHERPFIVDSTNWAASCRIVSDALKHIAGAYASFTELEESLGVDRYLGSKVVVEDLERVHSVVRQIGDQAHVALDGPRRIYLRQWNVAQIAPIILGLLGIRGPISILTEYFPSDQQRVIFLLVDALGYTQFHWFLRTVAQHAASPLAGNIFAWLREHRAYNDTYLLASNLVSVTGTCLPTIYTGALPRETGIIGSHMLVGGRVLNMLKGYDQSRGRSLSKREIAAIYRRNVNRGVIPLVEIAQRNGVDVRIFHAGPIAFAPLAQYTYGQLANDSNRTRVVTQADRVFSEAMDTFGHWAREQVRQQLALIYYPLIDSSGHYCGPYTQFQATELAKLNFLFTHFLIELVEHSEPFFDGKTSVVISADHGMFESSSKVASERMIRQAAQGILPEDAIVIYDNRACHIYGVPDDRLEDVRDALDLFFKASGFPIAISTKHDDLILELLYNPDEPYSANCPDLILQFYGPGIFYHKENLEPHMFLYGAHGGCSVDETFVPLIHFSLTPELATELKRLYW